MTATQDRLGEGIESRQSSAHVADGSRKFRADVQGLRAVAVTLVVLYHCGVTWIGGGYVGVDVFFVISGFLITSHLYGELTRTGRISLSSFYARRARRLLPSALVVVVTVVVLARVFGPVLQVSRTTIDGFFTLFYGLNYRLAAEGIDYQQANASPSPLQHFWSLAVEEQFYLLWPVCLILIGWLTMRSRSSRAVVATAAIFVIVVVSFSVSLHVTSINAPLAYFSLQSRAWELGLGAALAVILSTRRRLPAALAATSTWAGLAMVLGSALVLTDQTPFPGTAALWPTLGACLVLAGGASSPPNGVERVLKGRVTQLVGNVSYGWYLWHWPAIILGPAIFGHAFSTVENLEVSLLALWFATLSYTLIERPMPKIKIALLQWLPAGVSMTLVAGVILTGVHALGPAIQGDGATVSAVDLNQQGMVTLRRTFASENSAAVPINLQPSLEAAANDTPPTSDDGCHVVFLKTAQPTDCTFGDTSAARTMLLFGDSHAQQWFGALDAIAKKLHYRLVSWTKVACPVADTVLVNEQLGRKYDECRTWRDQRLAAMAKLRPDIVVASQTDTLPGASYDSALWAAQTASTLRRISRTTPDLILIGDTPRPARDIPTCLTENLQSVSKCAVPSDSGWQPGSEFGYLAKRHLDIANAVEPVDLTRVNPQDWFCLNASCPAVVGNTLVYRDDSHMTQAYSRVIAPLLEPVIVESLRSAQ